jgi:hypothetical protein
MEPWPPITPPWIIQFADPLRFYPTLPPAAVAAQFLGENGTSLGGGDPVASSSLIGNAAAVTTGHVRPSNLGGPYPGAPVAPMATRPRRAH